MYGWVSGPRVSCSLSLTDAQTFSLHDRRAGGLKKGHATVTGCSQVQPCPQLSPSDASGLWVTLDPHLVCA